MRIRSILTWHLLLAVSAVWPRAASAVLVDPEFWQTNGRVTTTLLVGDTLYVGGLFSYVGPGTGGCVALDPGTGRPMSGWPRVNGSVHAAAADGAGGWFIGGVFSSICGVARTNLAHLRADGSLDAWDPAADGPVHAIAVHGRNVYVGGAFEVVGGSLRSGLAAIDVRTALATDWAPTPNGAVRALFVLDGVVYAGGDFTIVGGRSRRFVAALDTSTAIASAWNPDANGAVTVIEAGGDVVYVGGGFTRIGGQPRSCVAALGIGSGLATAWNPTASDTVFALALGPGRIYAGGSFSSIGGQVRACLAALDATTGEALSWNPGANGVVRDLAVSGTSIHVAGGFSILGGATRRSLAELDANSGIVTAWDPGASAPAHTIEKGAFSVLVGGEFTSAGGFARDNVAAIDVTTGAATSWNPGANGEVSSLILGGGRLYVGGKYSFIGGQARNKVAELDSRTGAATSWDSRLNFPLIVSLAANASRVFVAGPVIQPPNGVNRTLFAAVDAVTGADLGWNIAASDDILTLVATPSRLYLGGGFTEIGGQPRNRLAALDAASGVVTSWNPGASTDVEDLAASGSLVYATGFFTTIGGQPRNYAAALDSLTGVPTSWTPGLTTYCFEIATGGGTVYIPGANTAFPWAPAGPYGEVGFAVTDSATGLSREWVPAALSTSHSGCRVYSLSPSTTEVFAGGLFTHLAGVPSPNLGRVIHGSPVGPAVTVHAPNGGEHSNLGDSLSIRWQAVADVRGIQSVDLSVSRSGVAGPWELVAAGLPNTGEYVWREPGPPASNTCLLRVDARNWDGTIGTDLSDLPFTIESDSTGGPVEPPIERFALAPPSPNPVNGVSSIRFELPSRMRVRLALFDLQGREVARLTEGVQDPGAHAVALDGGALEPGLYFLRLLAPGADLRRRVIVLP